MHTFGHKYPISFFTAFLLANAASKLSLGGTIRDIIHGKSHYT